MASSPATSASVPGGCNSCSNGADRMIGVCASREALYSGPWEEECQITVRNAKEEKAARAQGFHEDPAVVNQNAVSVLAGRVEELQSQVQFLVSGEGKPPAESQRTKLPREYPLPGTTGPDVRKRVADAKKALDKEAAARAAADPSVH